MILGPNVMGWDSCPECRSGRGHYEDCKLADAQESVLAIRLYNTQQVAADLAARLNDLHREACVDEPLAALLLLPLIGEANNIERKLTQLMEVRK